MTNTVPLKKQNKRAQKEYHSKKRGSWYDIACDAQRTEWESL